jgi:hypothetical protein
VKEGEFMIKRIIACFLIALSLMSFGTFAYATNVDASKYAILNPEKLTYSTEDKVILINGKAPSGTEITLDIYGTIDTADLRKSNFDLNNLPSEEDYILITNNKVTSGNMGLFSKQLDLVKGINKIVIDYGVEGVEPVEIIVYVYNRDRTKVREPRISDIIQKPKPLLK